MSKKGFTLVELVVVIGLVALIGIIVSTNMIGLNNKQKEKDYEKLARSFEDAAVTYIGLNKNLSKTKLMNRTVTNLPVTLNELFQAGLLDENIKNPLTDENFTYSMTVTIEYKTTGEFTYCFNDPTYWNCNVNPHAWKE